MLFTFVYYICFTQIINICSDISVQSFTHTVQFLIYRSLFVCSAIILVTLPSHHTTLPSHHTAVTPHCCHTTLPSHHTTITPHCHHTTLPSHHTTLTQYLTFTYLKRAAMLLQAVTRFNSGRASVLCCCPSINRSRWFRSWAGPSVKNSILLRCVTRTFEQFII